MLSTFRRLVICGVWLSAISATSAASIDPCPPAAPCETASGTYLMAIPDGWDGTSKLPALLYFHGFNSSAGRALKGGGLRASFLKRGYAIIAPNGDRFPGRNTRFWPARPANGEFRDDVKFILEVMADAAAKAPIDPAKILVAGFSAGGSMAWMMGCYEGQRFAGVVSVAGALRRPVPETGKCPGGPFRLLHIHGFSDNQVPLEGRGIRDWHQGDVFQSLSILRATNRCRSNPTSIGMGKRFRCRNWRGCPSGKDVRLCMHDGGHGLPTGWAEEARKWFER